MTFEAQANEVTLDKITFYDITMRYGQRDRAVSQFAINSGLYNGTMLLSGTADLTKETIPIQGLLRADKVDLSLIRRDFDIKDKKFSGKLKTETKFQTTAADFLNLKGQGSLDIGEGYLWHLIPQL